LGLGQWDVPAPAASEVTIQVKASALNFPDVMCIHGLYPTMPDYPFVPGFEVSGILSAVGPDAEGHLIGDEVIALTGKQMGGHAAYVNVPAANVIRKPRNISFEDACSLPVVFSTVYYAFELAHLGSQEHVLIHSAAGGCGLMAFQLANLRQSVCYGTSRSETKLAFLKDAGFAEVINSKNTDFETEIKRLTANRGVDVVLNNLAGDALQKGINCLAPFGRYLELAAQGLKTNRSVDLSSLVRNQSVHSIDLRRFGIEKGFQGKTSLETMASMLQANAIVPLVSRVYPLNQITEALQYVSEGRHLGKVVISHTSQEMVDRTGECAEALRRQRLCAMRGKPRSAPLTSASLSAGPQAPEQIAIIGMAGRFPKGPDVETFWKNIADGVDCISEVPQERWSVYEFYQPGAKVAGKSYAKWMGVLEDAELFDPLFFNISPAEAERMDPQQRLFLEASWHCIEDAAIRPSSLSGSRCGVFVGCASSEYGRDQSKDGLNSHALMGGASSILAARISYFLNLKGPSLAIDTACSSSLVALAQACDSLILGSSDVALAGGVHMMYGPAMHIMTSQAGMLSDAGRCFAFDARANGFVPGEGVGVVLLKRLSDAIRDGDWIAGIIRGWGVNQDGRTNGITAPSAKSQTALELDVYRRSQTDPETIRLVEAHGTGTALGDPVEVEALTDAFASFTNRRNYCALGTVKSNIGHLMTAAGIAGVIKVLLALRHQMLPPTIHFSALNPHIALDSSPFYINTHLQPWAEESDVPRRACVSSFGFSGTNAHVVIEEFAAPARQQLNGPVVFVLSARTQAQLKSYAQRIIEFLRQNETVDLRDLAYTLQVGRESMEYRIAATVTSRESLGNALSEYIAGQTDQLMCQGRVDGGCSVTTPFDDALLPSWLETNGLQKVAEAWTHGSEVNWDLLYPGAKPRRLRLPGYPFARKICSFSRSETALVAGHEADAVLHPLVHRNTSDLRRQRYTSEGFGSEVYFNDHQILGDRVLAGSALLEMARFAVQDASGDAPPQLSLRDVVWIRPCVFSHPIKIHIFVDLKESGEIAFEIAGDENGGEVYCRGRAGLAPHARPRLALQTLQSECRLEVISGNSFYDGLNKSDFHFGPSHRAIRNIFRGENQALAELALPEGLFRREPRFVLHPGMLDSALQAAALVLADHGIDGALLPFALDDLTVFAPMSATMSAYVRRSSASQNSGAIQKSDIDLLDDRGEVCVSISGFSMRPWKEGSVPQIERSRHNLSLPVIFRPVWTRSDLFLPPSPERVETHLIVLCETLEIDRDAVEQTLGHVECLYLNSPALDSERYGLYCERILRALQSVQSAATRGRILVQVVGSAKARLILRGMTGLLKTAERELSSMCGQVIELIGSPTASEILQTLRDEAQDWRSREVRYVESNRFVAEWASVPWTEDAPSPWKDKGVYVIAGGGGKLGLLLAREIAHSAANPTLVLAGRSSPSPSVVTELNHIRSLGATVSCDRVDISDSDAVSDWINRVQNEHGGITGVIHVAGVIKDNYLHNKTAEECREVLAPKVAGVLALDRATRDIALDLFLVFSSVAGALGNAGQADYASANAFLDAYAEHRSELVASKQRSGRTLSMNWPLWRDGGMQIDAATSRRMKESGWDGLETRAAFRALNQCIAGEQSHFLVASGDPEKIRRLLLPLQPVTDPSTVGNKELVAGNLTQTLRHIISGLLKIEEQEIDGNTEWSEFGFDSISLTDFAGQISQRFGIDLSPTIFFEHPTLEGLAAFLREQFGTAFPQARVPQPAQRSEVKQSVQAPESLRLASAAAEPLRAVPKSSPQPIAVIGMSGCFPQARDLDAFWRNLVDGRDCIEEIPASRWDWRAFYGDPSQEDNKTRIKYGGFIEGVDEFDPLFFNISPAEAEMMDPQQRLLLTHVWRAIEDSGHAPESLAGSATAIFVGTGASGYGTILQAARVPLKGYSSTSSVPSLGPNRISFLLDLHGPSEPIETACSSSLVAVHRALMAIENGLCDTAIVGGVNTILTPEGHIGFGKAGMLSEDGRCKTFSDRADGYVRSEGVAVLILKRLQLAERDGDHIYGLLCGSAENHGGRAASLTAPNAKAQAAVLEAAYARAGIDPRTVTYIEAHGTGTPLGDPVEVNALKAAFLSLQRCGDPSLDVTASCGLGSVKSNIGHLELAAGIAGLVKVLLQLRYKTLVGTLHCETINPYIDLQASPFYIVRKTKAWTALKDPNGRAIPRRAGVSSFGFGGVNTHVIVEEYVAKPDSDAYSQWKGPALIVLSARNGRQLRQQAEQLIAALERASWSDSDLPSIAFTLQAGRDAMEERLGIAGVSLADLKAKLDLFLRGEAASEKVWHSADKRVRQALSAFSADEDLAAAIATWIAKEKYDLLLEFWTKGGVIAWEKLYGETKPKRLSLPAYPFARDRYWPSVSGSLILPLPDVQRGGWLHPLLHRNTSDLAAQRFSSTFFGDESFLADHIVQGRKTLPAAVYLEMARAAFFLSSGHAAAPARGIRLCDVVWLRPALVEDRELEIHVSLVPDRADDVRFCISPDASGGSGLDVNSRTYCRGRAEHFPIESIPRLDLPALRAACGLEQLTSEQCYRAFDACGLVYGPAHRTVRTIYRGSNQVVAEIVAPKPAAYFDQHVILHPNRLDGALQTIIGLFPVEAGREPLVPFALGALEIFAPIPARAWVWIRPSQSSGGGDSTPRLNLDLVDEDGQLCVRIREFTARAVKSGGVSQEAGGPDESGAHPDRLAATTPKDAVSPTESATTFAIGRILVEEISTILKLRPTDLDPDSELTDFGFDSITLTEFAAHLNSEYDLEISPTLFFECPTIRALAIYLAATYAQHFLQKPAGTSETNSGTDDFPAQLQTSQAFAAPAGRRFRPAPSPDQNRSLQGADPIAIIGMSGRFPLAADLDEFWRNLVEGRDCVQEIPPSRWDWRRFYGSPETEANKTNIKWGCFIDGVGEFDPLFFGISPAEAELMDPQQRLLMTYAWHVIEDAGYAPQELSGTNTGVFVGTGQTGYGSLIDQAGIEIKGYSSTGSVPSVGPNRLSYFLNLRGPSEPVETACSSSLVALHRAIAAIRGGECDMALAGGVNTIVTPAAHIAFNQAGMLSQNGRCKAFAEEADGYVRGEGVGMLMLKRASQAEADGDHIYGIIRGSAVNHGGRTASLTAPSPKAQAELLMRAYRAAGVCPETVTYVEAHGTGTQLGDPIEIDGLKKAFAALDLDGHGREIQKSHCGLGSVKSNIGHLELAAGVAGVIKVLLQFKHKTLVRTLHCEHINSHISLEDTPFYIVRETRPWQALADSSDRPLPRRAGVSSFGFGGVNAHVVLEEHIPASHFPRARSAEPCLIVLSAKNEARLMERAEQLVRALNGERWGDEALRSIAYTLQVGRDPMDERLGFLASSVDEFRAKLTAYVQGQSAPGELCRGQAKRTNKEILSLLSEDQELQERISQWFERKKFTKILNLWARGATIDWRMLYVPPFPNRVSLPSYPFARETYWVPSTQPSRLSPLGRAARVLHPLLHGNSEDLGGQEYTSTFTGEEFFLRDHVVRGERILPAVAYLEMAREAVAQATSTMSPASITLRNIVWLRPFMVRDRASQIHISLRRQDEREIEFELYGYDSGSDSGTRQVLARGYARLSESAHPPQIDIASKQAACTHRRLSAAECYERLASTGLTYGPSFRGLDEVLVGSSQVVARVRLPADAATENTPEYVLHPSVMDAALQACFGLWEGAGSPGVPFGLDLLEMWGPSPQNGFVFAAARPRPEAADGVSKLDVSFCDLYGSVRIKMSGLSIRRLPEEALHEERGTLILRPVWRDLQAERKEESNEPQVRYVVLCELPEIAVDRIASRLPGTQCLSLDSPTDPPHRRFINHAARIVGEIQEHLKRHGRTPALLQIVIPGEGDDRLLRGLAGLVKTARLEEPALRTQLIEIDMSMASPQAPDDVIEKLNHAAAADRHCHIAYRAGRTLNPDWEEVISPPHSAMPWRDEGVYLITGGAGGLGRVVAQDIASAVARPTIVLVGRSAVLEAGVHGWIPIDKSRTARIEYRAADVTRAADCSKLIESVLREFGKLNGIIHAAGVIRDNHIRNKSQEEFEEVLAPKVSGLRNLDEASKDVDLDFFILFSSLAGVFGNAGQSDYAAANAFLDAYATYRNELVSSRKRGGKTVSLNWPLWRQGGMTVNPASEKIIMQTTGLMPMETGAGMDALSRSIASGEEQLLVVSGNLDKIRKTLFHGASQTLGPTARDAGRDRESFQPANQRMVQELGEALRTTVGNLLKVDVHLIDPEGDLSEFGLDSITLTELTNHLNLTYGFDLAPTIFFEYRTLQAVSEYLACTYAEKLAPAFRRAVITVPPAEPTKAPEPVQQLRHSVLGKEAEPTPLAVVGMSGRFPKAADLDAFWENLVNGVDCISEIPESRWNWRDFFGDPNREANKTKVKWGAFIDGVDEFDPLFFGISPSEAEVMDPQQRLLMQYVWLAIEDSGYAPRSLGGTRTGIFVATGNTGYSSLMDRANLAIQGYSSAGAVPSIGPNRMSYLLDLHGPSEPIETACSSSLVAIHRAMEAIHCGSCDMAIAGGVNTIVTPGAHIGFDKAGMLSSDGRCKTFDQRADGYVRGEGVGMLFLKRLRDAEEAGDWIHGVIRSSAVNHGGRAKSLTAPNPNAQADLIRNVYTKAGVDPRSVTYIETHGTGTQLGDPIEINGLKAAFARLYEEIGEKVVEQHHCGLASVKSNIGHLELAAGVAAVIKVLLQLKHKKLVKTLHCETVNSFIKLEDSPFFIIRDLQDWQPVHDDSGRLLPRRAGVSSFGFGGVNAHVMIEEYVPKVATAESIPRVPVAVVLSARTVEQLSRQASNLLGAIRKRSWSISDLNSIAFTLQAGREAMEERLAVIVDSPEALGASLQSFLDGHTGMENVFREQVSERGTSPSPAQEGDLQHAMEAWIARGQLANLLRLWIRGAPVDWSTLYRGAKPRRIPLPGYPFAQNRYWVPTQSATPANGASKDHKDSRQQGLREIPSVIGRLQKRISSPSSGMESLSLIEDHQ
jgi:polyketide synthase PksN